MKQKSIIPGILILFLFVSFVVVPTEKTTDTSPRKIPANVKAIIDRSCFGCHNTDSRNEDAKEDLDFKKFDTLTQFKMIGTYKKIGEMLEKQKMPPSKFLDRFPEKKLTDEETSVLMNWAKREAGALLKK
ncbi:MAG: heme-binding domain-containing protein [Draconibacterium sp.]|nr:heme-binding domain-containing protein [Draconibacterium sp.]